MHPWMRILFAGLALVGLTTIVVGVFLNNGNLSTSSRTDVGINVQPTTESTNQQTEQTAQDTSTQDIETANTRVPVNTAQQPTIAENATQEVAQASNFDVADLGIDVGISSANQVLLGEPISFEATLSSFDVDLVREIDYIWSFGDNMTATGAQIAHRYNQPGTYTATLTVEIVDANRTFHRHVERKTVEVNLPALPSVMADFRMTPNDQIVSQSDVLFDAGLSSLSNALPASLTPNWEYTWEVENAAGIKEIRLQGEKVHYQFAVPQTYQVTLTATMTDQFGRTQMAQKQSSITVDNRAPIPVVFTEPKRASNTVYAGEAVVFNASETIDPEKSDLTFEWDFNGDNIVDHIGTEPRVEWQQGFTQGTHTVIVRVKDAYMQERPHIPAIVHPIKVEVTGRPVASPMKAMDMPVFASGGLGLIGNFQLANGLAGFRIGKTPFSTTVGFGINTDVLSIDQTHMFPQVSKAFPSAKVMTEIDTAMMFSTGLMYRVADNFHLSFGGGLLTLEGQHRSNHPRVTIDHQDKIRFHQSLPVATLGVAYQLNFALLSFQVNLVL